MCVCVWQGTNLVHGVDLGDSDDDCGGVGGVGGVGGDELAGTRTTSLGDGGGTYNLAASTGNLCSATGS